MKKLLAKISLALSTFVLNAQTHAGVWTSS